MYKYKKMNPAKFLPAKWQMYALILWGIINICDAKAQYINNIYVLPPSPTSADSIIIVADCTYITTSCDTHEQSGYWNNSHTFWASTFHCLGMADALCNDTDTFKLAPLTAGNYTFVLHTSIGNLPFPCTPLAGFEQTQSINFVVTPNTYLAQPAAYPALHNNNDNNPAVAPQLYIEHRQLRIDQIAQFLAATQNDKSSSPIQIQILSYIGQPIAPKTYIAADNPPTEVFIPLYGAAPAGIYFCEIRAGNRSPKVIPFLLL